MRTSPYVCRGWQAHSQAAANAGAATAEHPSREGASGQGPCSEGSPQHPRGVLSSLCTVASCIVAADLRMPQAFSVLFSYNSAASRVMMSLFFLALKVNLQRGSLALHHSALACA